MHSAGPRAELLNRRPGLEDKKEWLVWLIRIPGGTKAELIGTGLVIEYAVTTEEGSRA
jgi:hypothetical protein